MKYPDKYNKSTEELLQLSKKDLIKYFNKKRAYLARKLLANPFDAVSEFEKLSDQQLATGAITKEQHEEFRTTLQDQITEFQSMQPHEIKQTLVDEARNVKNSAASTVKGWFGR